VKMGTTVANNALLERTGMPTVLAIKAGHGDALRIGNQSRPRLFDRHIRLPEALYSRVIEIDERLAVEGTIQQPLDEAAAHHDLQQAYDEGFRAVAIVLLHGYRYPAHEQRVGAIARAIGYTQVSISHDVSPLIKLVGRSDTTVVDAYLTPVLQEYMDRVVSDLGDDPGRLLFMQSSGGLIAAGSFRGKDAVLSGPAGGIVGMAATARDAGVDAVIGFDMGGTSTDVSHYAGRYERSYETVVAGVRLCAPMMDIHTIAAGGGSICRFDGVRLRVGPASAGAIPGPASYRRGGPLTITDCNLLLGKIQPAFFPAVFGPQANEPLDRQAVVQRFEQLSNEVHDATGERLTASELALGFLRIAIENMARAIKQISTQRGHDVTRYTLACFGGAGGQHACLVADALGMPRVMIHPFAGVLSAYGMGLADVRVLREQTVESPLSLPSHAVLERSAASLSDEARNALLAQGLQHDAIEVQLRARIKIDGTDTGLSIPFSDSDTMRIAFEDMHRKQFGFMPDGKLLIVEMIMAEAVGSTRTPRMIDAPSGPAGVSPSVLATVSMVGAQGSQDVAVHDRETLPPGTVIEGPTIIREVTATTVVEAGWHARVDDFRNLMLERIVAFDKKPALRDTRRDPVLLEVFNSLFMAVAERMGYALQSTAYSVNIKERLDFSCALFDAQANLIANAPHIPVHLGSMGDSVRAIIARRAQQRPFRRGDVYMLNAPYNGGTHLPDITVVMPVFDTSNTVMAYVAARGHHADIGGITPGSMPPRSRSVEEEGVLIDDFLLVDEGRFREAETLALLAGGPWPARIPSQNIADLKAQIAACVRGADELAELVATHGRDVIDAYMAYVQDNAEESVRRVLASLEGGEACCEMDDGATIKVAITVDRERRTARVDFSGTSTQRDNNFNAPLSICRAAVMYVFRTLVDDDIPLNEGCLRPIELIVPEGSMLNPRYPAAVVAGNVETSQAVTDALYAALGVLAGAQGTMNNLTFGDDRRQYYETICGGAGAGPDFDGASAVQTHMTNSRLTDVEVLESRFPVLVERFAIRPHSGGEGRQCGGDGVVRVIRFREPMTAAILSNRRRIAPSGLHGGGDGTLGRNTIRHSDGTVDGLASTDVANMMAGDAIIIETPGGGGYGSR